MSIAADIEGGVFVNDSATLLARVVGADGSAITQASLSSAKYSAYLLDYLGKDVESNVTNHQDINCIVAMLIFNALQTDDLWDDYDATGYNLKWVLDVSANQIFTAAGRYYRIEFELTPTSGQVIRVRFKLKTT